MAEESNSHPTRRPTMLCAALSALALLALTALLTRAVLHTPSPVQTQDEVEVPNVASGPSVRPTSQTQKVPIQLLRSPSAGRSLAVRPIAEKETAAHRGVRHTPPIRARHGLVAHKLDLDDSPFPVFKIETEESADDASSSFEDSLLIPHGRTKNPADRPKTRRVKVGGSSPARKVDALSGKRPPLLMESADWHITRQLGPPMEARRDRIRQCLEFYYNRPLRSADDSPWSMMHHMIAWGVDSRILVIDSERKTRNISTIAWLCGNGACRDERLLIVKDGRLHARVGPGLQGHEAQFLALLAQARVSLKQVMLVDGEQFTIADLIREEQLACRPRAELTFKLIAFSHYLPLNTQWKNDKGEHWNLERIIKEELRQPINGTTCGGTHRLMGFSYAAARRRQDGDPLTGEWAQAQLVARKHQELAFQMQNRDGSFSSDFFRSSGSWGDIDRKLKTTGHILEWMVFSLPHDELDDPRILRSVDYVCQLLAQNRYYDWENGPLGHAILRWLCTMNVLLAVDRVIEICKWRKTCRGFPRRPGSDLPFRTKTRMPEVFLAFVVPNARFSACRGSSENLNSIGSCCATACNTAVAGSTPLTLSPFRLISRAAAADWAHGSRFAREEPDAYPLRQT